MHRPVEALVRLVESSTENTQRGQAGMVGLIQEMTSSETLALRVYC